MDTTQELIEKERAKAAEAKAAEAKARKARAKAKADSGEDRQWIPLDHADAKACLKPRTVAQLANVWSERYARYTSLPMLREHGMWTDDRMLIRLGPVLRAKLKVALESIATSATKSPRWQALWFEDKPNGRDAQLVGVRELGDDRYPKNPQALLRDDSGAYTILDARFVAEVLREYPRASWRVWGPGEPVHAYSDGKLSALVMPITLKSGKPWSPEWRKGVQS